MAPLTSYGVAGGFSPKLTLASAFGSLREDSRVLRATPYVVLAMMVAMWAGAGVAFSSGQWGDHFEQFVWAHSVEWGYHKHPPLPTWLLAIALELFGPSIESARALAVACVLGTGILTFLIAQELFKRSTAALALLFWGLQHPFSQRCQLYNHNTVLMLTASATAWCVLRALRSPRSVPWWFAAGCGAGLSLLAKYQALVPLTGIAVALWLSGDLRKPAVRLGMLVATAVAVAVFLPHAAWLTRHGFTTIEYATQQGQLLAWPARAASVGGFVIQQLRFLLPVLLLSVLLHCVTRKAVAGSCLKPQPLAARQRAWLIGLIAFPLAATLLTAPLFGLRLQNHWGYQALQFAGLAFAWLLSSRVTVARPAWLAWGLVVHATFLAVALLSASHPALDQGGRQDVRYPAQQLADSVRQDWQDETSCPLRIVVGPAFEAGIVSVYNGGTAAVVEEGDFAKSPWISPDDVERRGAVYVSLDRDKLPSKRVVRVGTLDASIAYPSRTYVYWAVVPPPTCGSAPHEQQ